MLDTLREARLLAKSIKCAHGPALAIDLPSMGEMQFIEPVLSLYLARNPGKPVVLVHQRNTLSEFHQCYPMLAKQVLHVSRRALDAVPISDIRVFLTTEQYDQGIDGIYSIAMFHGQAAKGLSFVPEVINSFDGLFLIGKMHQQAYKHYLADFPAAAKFSAPDLFEIGYPKSDALLQARIDRCAVARSLKRYNANRKTVLYAPAFNEGASLRECGIDVIRNLVASNEWNVIAKLPIDCAEPLTNHYATGGVNWAETLAELEVNHPNFELVNDFEIDPLLSLADVLITCISSVSFEFMALEKPVIFIDVPRYYASTLPHRFPELDTSSWRHRVTVNAGQRFGPVVSRPDELNAVVAKVLASPEEFPYDRPWLAENLLFNRGSASLRAVEVLESLLANPPALRRPSHRIQRELHRLFTLIAKAIIPAPVRAIVRRLIANPAGTIRSIELAFWRKILGLRGYVPRPAGEAYIDGRHTIAAARRAGLSICEYLENREADPRKHGRRSRIVAALMTHVATRELRTIVEIGAGTGMYTEKLLPHAGLLRYEIYETSRDWRNYLTTSYRGKSRVDFIVHEANGELLAGTADASCDLVHAHGVFVYVPILVFVSYCREAARILAPGGYFVFDCYLSSSFSAESVDRWLASDWRFPVVLPDTLVHEITASAGLHLQAQFQEVHGAGHVDYLVFKKG